MESSGPEVIAAYVKAYHAAGAVVLRNQKAEGKIRFRYADLGAVIQTIGEALEANDLAPLQTVERDEADTWVVTNLLHGPSGQVITSRMPLREEEGRLTASQALGSAVSYSRRYGLLCLMGLATEDDDGNHRRTERDPPTAAAGRVEAPAITAEQLEAGIKTSGVSRQEAATLMARRSWRNPGEMDGRQRAWLLGWLESEEGLRDLATLRAED